MQDTIWNAGQVDALDRFILPRYVRHTHRGNVLTASALKGTIRTTRQAFPDLQTTVESIVDEAGLVAFRWRAEGTHLGTFLEVPATGKTVQVQGMSFLQFDAELIREDWVTWDLYDMLSGLGVIPIGGGHRQPVL
jgi:steroid delta-isomerase-like uncharacterized protein